MGNDFSRFVPFYVVKCLLISGKRANFAGVIELERHIEVLLLKYECVIVPGLGGFMTHHVDARYDEDESLFLPPLRTLGFNPQLQLNDSLLAQSYVEAYDISYPEAVQRIEEEVNELRQHIQNEGSYELNDIGVLSINDDGKYEFEPCEAGVLTPWLYGLGSFEMKKCSAGETSGKGEDNGGRKDVAPVAAEIATDGLRQDAAAGDETDVIRLKVSWIRNAIAMVAAVAAFFLITPPISNSGGQNAANVGSLQGVLFTDAWSGNTFASDGGAVSGGIPSEAMVADTVKPMPKPVVESVPADTVVPMVKDDAYCIVLASRITQSNANAFVGELRKNGLKDVSVYVNNDIVRVVYGSYATEREAYGTLRSVRDNKYFEQAWVYKKQ